jgi:nuclear pore complex protein Nup107
VLVLRSVNEPVPESAANVIIEAYLMVLKSEGNDSLVAMYAACLREGNGEESYARFLRSMDPNATAQQKQDALMLAKQHSLDVATIAKLTVSHILKHEFETIPALSTDQPDITAFSARLDERDVRLIRSLEWLTFVPETRGEALVRANDITRYFLALGKANAAHALLRSLPSFASITEEEDGDNQLLEHEQYTHLFGIFAAHDAVDKALAEAPKATATKIDQAAWRKLLLSAVERVHADTVALLTSRWLRFSVRADSRAADRRKELRRIRQIFVPDLVLRLHHVLVDNRARLPDAPLLQRALDLTKLVAAEEHHVYDEFLGQDDRPFRLVAYLDRVREASLDALAAGSMSPFIA